MSREHRLRAWLVANQSTLDELRSAEIRLAVAVDALHREATARHAETADLVDEIGAAAAELSRDAATASELDDVPDLRGQLFFHTACQRFLAVAEQLSTVRQRTAPEDLSEAAKEIRIGRDELDEALAIIAESARSERHP
jgi:hypothetical protein